MSIHYEVWKFDIASISDGIPKSLFQLEMPALARVLTVQVQHGKICLWALCDVKAEKEQRDFVIIGTGHHMLRGEGGLDLLYVGTVQFVDGSLVFHVFEFANGKNGR